MGCCSSTERSSHGANTQQPETAASPSSSANPLASNGGYSGTRSGDIYSPASSRAPLTGPESNSVVSSPRQSTTNRRRSTGTQRSNVDGTLSSHYNLPLVAPKAWKSTNKTWTPTTAAKERQDFFDTRVTGRTEIWEALRQVSECIFENDLGTAQGILTAAGITLPTGRLEDGCYDERGELYRIPHIIVRNPENIRPDGEEDEEVVIEDERQTKELALDKSSDVAVTPTSEIHRSEKGKDVIDANGVTIKCRLSSTGTDINVLLGKDQAAGLLFYRLKEQVTNESYSKIRVFYLGKELTEKEKLTLDDFGWREGHVLNIFVVSITT